MKRKASEIEPAVRRYVGQVEAALIKKFNRDEATAAEWAADELPWICDMLDVGQSAQQTAHELFMRKIEV